MEHAYFVTIHAQDHASLLKLASYELDLLHQTAVSMSVAATVAREVGPRPHGGEGDHDEDTSTSIDGLLGIDQIMQLVDDGYQVLVREGASKRARASQTMQFEDWLKAITEE
jgi:hypothetical protein